MQEKGAYHTCFLGNQEQRLPNETEGILLALRVPLHDQEIQPHLSPQRQDVHQRGDQDNGVHQRNSMQNEGELWFGTLSHFDRHFPLSVPQGNRPAAQAIQYQLD